jgi:phage-related protein
MLQKPAWLVNALSYLNWDIFGWQIYVGDSVENAIDWVLDGINTIITWAQQIGAWLDELRQEILDFFSEIPKWINEVWQRLLNFIDSVGDIIATWWMATWQMVQDWVNTVVDTVKDGLKLVADAAEWLRGQWDTFFTSILPTLASRFDVYEIVSAILSSFLPLFTLIENLRNELVEFFTNPLEYIWQRFTDWFFGGK